MKPILGQKRVRLNMFQCRDIAIYVFSNGRNSPIVCDTTYMITSDGITYLTYFIVIGTSIWVFIDANQNKIPIGKTPFAGSDAFRWLAVCVILWIVGFPVYPFRRARTLKERINPPVAAAFTPPNLPFPVAAASSYVATEHIAARFCPQCGTPVVLGARFCNACGKPV